MSTPVQPRPNPRPAPRPTTQMMIGCVVIPFIMVAILAGGFIYVRSNSSSRLTVPDRAVLRVYAAPDSSAPLLARFGQGQPVKITGRSADWRWLEVELWNDQVGWTLRPLDILVWQLNASPATPAPTKSPIAMVTPVVEQMVTIPATTYTMGSPPGLGEDDERPAHPVTLAAFEIDRTEVTVGQYWQCVEAGACAAPIDTGNVPAANYLNDPAFDNYPMVNVPWLEASRYCSWLGKRLPTEAEWELSAGWDNQRGAKLLWPWGNDPIQEQVNVTGASVGQPAVVGSFALDHSSSGVADMAGNVSEWVFDWYQADYYSVADDTNPAGPSNRRSEGRVIRGGSFADPLDQARVTNRRHQDEAYGYPTVGFRCAKDKP